MYDAIDDPYTYENSTVLVNKLREQAELDAFEAEISLARAAEPLPEGTLDFTPYEAVHNHLFQDVYEWAGQVRTVRMFKGGNPFCFPENIENQATKLFGELQADNFLHGLWRRGETCKCHRRSYPLTQSKFAAFPNSGTL